MKPVRPTIPYTLRALIEKLVQAKNVAETREAARELGGLLLRFDRSPDRAWADAILAALRDAGFDKDRAAVLLGVEPRTLYRHIDALSMHSEIARAMALAGKAPGGGRPPSSLLEARARRARASVLAARKPIGTIHAGYVQPNGEEGFLVRPRGGEDASDSIAAPVVLLDEVVDSGSVPQDLFEVVPAVVSSGWLFAHDGDGAELPDPGLD